MFKSYPGDPYWMMAQHAGRCDGCGVHFPKGERCFRYKRGQMYAERCGCGQAHEQDFLSMAQDEAMMGGR